MGLGFDVVRDHQALAGAERPSDGDRGAVAVGRRLVAHRQRRRRRASARRESVEQRELDRQQVDVVGVAHIHAVNLVVERRPHRVVGAHDRGERGLARAGPPVALAGERQHPSAHRAGRRVGRLRRRLQDRLQHLAQRRGERRGEVVARDGRRRAEGRARVLDTHRPAGVIRAKSALQSAQMRWRQAARRSHHQRRNEARSTRSAHAVLLEQHVHHQGPLRPQAVKRHRHGVLVEAQLAPVPGAVLELRRRRLRVCGDGSFTSSVRKQKQTFLQFRFLQSSRARRIDPSLTHTHLHDVSEVDAAAMAVVEVVHESHGLSSPQERLDHLNDPPARGVR